MNEDEALQGWLNTIASENVVQLGLARVKALAQKLALLPESTTKVITVAGTNGKGSTVKALTELALCAGISVGTFTSPHIYRFNERACIDGEPVETTLLLTAFNAISQDASSASLTYFEWSFLVALWVFKVTKPELIVLEVGLGGRLDATNVVDANLAIITSIGFDHMEYLGATLADIAKEKAGIFRQKQMIICAKTTVNQVFIDKAKALDATLLLEGRDFKVTSNDSAWSFVSDVLAFQLKERPSLKLSNIALAINAWLALGLPFDLAGFKANLTKFSLSFRQEWHKDKSNVLLDVSHNLQSILYLKEKLSNTTREVFMVFTMLADKDIQPCLLALKERVRAWFVPNIEQKRAKCLAALQEDFKAAEIKEASFYPSVQAALKAVTSQANEKDVIVVAGTFFLVAEAAKLLSEENIMETANG